MTRGGRLAELDGFRALAILPVLGLHLTYGRIVGGYLGVDLFFVLSGFLITSLLQADWAHTGTVSLRAFYARRALRILPPLFVTIVLALLVTPTSPLAGLEVLFFLANFVDRFTLGGLLHTWSLSIEEHFYFLWPFLFLVSARWRIPGLVGAILLIVATRIILVLWGADAEDIYRWTFTRGDSIAIGCVVALWKPPIPGKWALPSAVALVLCLLFLPRGWEMLTIGFTLFAGLCAVAIAATLASPQEAAIRRFLLHPMLQYIGRRSYGLYLYHYPIWLGLEPLRASGDYANFLWITILRIAATFALAEISYRTVEAYAASFKERFAPPKSELRRAPA